jgi:hypothetical protein
VLRPTSFPKRRGVREMPLFVFVCAQRLHGCCLGLALTAGHGPYHRVCKPLGGIVAVQIHPIDGGRLPYGSAKVGSPRSIKVGSAKVGSAKVGSDKVGFAEVGSAKVGSTKVG